MSKQSGAPKSAQNKAQKQAKNSTAKAGGTRARRAARAKSDAKSDNFRTVARNRRATYDYAILDRYEAGLVLTGTEIKSIRQGKASIAEAYVRPKGDELWLVGATISPYIAGNRYNHEPTRDRKLLLHKRQIASLIEEFETRSLTIVPLHLYLSRGLAKIEIGVGRGRKHYDKRQQMSGRDAARQMQDAVRH